MPTVSPLGPTSRTSGTRIRSLMRSSVLMCPPVVVRRGRPGRTSRPAICPDMKKASADASGSHRGARAVRRHLCGACTCWTGPDDLMVLRSVRVGVSLRLSDRSCGPIGHDEPIGRRTRVQVRLRCLFRTSVADGRIQPQPSPTRARRPAAGQAARGPRPPPRTAPGRRRRPAARPRRPARRTGRPWRAGPAPAAPRRSTRSARRCW